MSTDIGALSLTAAASHYARKRWPVFPCQPNGKAPLTPNGFKDATSDPEQVERWWTEHPQANIGFVPGRAGFIVFDVDGEEGRAAATKLGLFAEPTLTVVTPRGWHLYFRHPGFHVSNRAPAPGVDVRGDDGYVLLPPSVHPSGDVYRPDHAAVLALPPDVMAAFNGNGQPPAAPPLPERIPAGQRNVTLLSLAGSMRRRGASEAGILAALEIENRLRCDPPLDEQELAAIAASAARYAPAPPPPAKPESGSRALEPDRRDEPGAAGPGLGDTDDQQPHEQQEHQQDEQQQQEPVVVRLADVQPEQVHWLWAARIPRGKLTILDGDPGLGKSTLALDIAARVTTGRPFPDAAPAGGPGGVVVLTAEDGLADTVRPRLDAMEGDATRIVALTAVQDVAGVVSPVSLPDHLDAVRTVVQTVGAVLVIIDPFTAYLASYVNSRIDHDIRRTLAPLAAMAEETGVALLLIRHLNKSNAGPALYRGGGSIGIIAAARSGLLVAEDPDDPTRRVFAVVKSNLAARAPSLAYRLEPAANGVARITWGGQSPHTASALLAVPQNPEERSAVDDAKAWLADVLGEGAQPPAEIIVAARSAGHSTRTIERAKAQLGVRSERRGFGSAGRWVWTLPQHIDRHSQPMAAYEDGAPGSLNNDKGLCIDRQDRQAAKDADVAVYGDPDTAARDAMREGA